MKLDKKNIPVVLVVVMFFWALMHPLSKMIVGDVPPVLLTFLRYGLGTVFMLVYFVFAKRSIKIENKDLIPLAIIGILGNGIANLFYFTGLNLSTATTASILINFSPLAIALLSPMLIGEKLKKQEMFGVLLAFLGIIFVIDGGSSIDSLVSSEYFYGNLLILFSASLVAVSTIYGKKYIHKYGGSVASFYTIFFSMMFMLPLTVYTGVFFQISSLSVFDWSVVVYLGLIAAFIFAILYASIRHIGAAKSTSFKLLIPVYATLVAVVFLGEVPSFYTLFGGILVLGGLFLTHRADREFK
ncbi:MAG: DMT family transporter [Candidatus Micrarchaeota archaeon]